MDDITPEQFLDLIVQMADPQEAMLVMVKRIFTVTAELSAAADAQTKVLGAIAGRLGIKGEQLRRLLDSEVSDGV